MLELKKSIAFFDIEATGLNIVKDRIVELCILKLNPDHSKEVKTWLVNPEVPISEEASKIHGYKNEDLTDKPTFKDVSNDVIEFIGNADLGGFNILRYDLPLIMEEFLRVGANFDFTKRKLIDVQKIFHTLEKRTLEAAYKFYCSKDLKNAHSAEADTLATEEILNAQVERYEQLGNTIEELNNFLGDPANQFVDLAGRIVYKGDVPVFNFGKYRGKPVKQVFAKDPSYYSWMMNGDFPQYTKKKLTEIRLSMKD